MSPLLYSLDFSQAARATPKIESSKKQGCNLLFYTECRARNFSS